MNVDDEGNAMFAFQDLDYIPCGYNSITAPYIPTLAGTMRAAAKLMKLRPSQEKMNELDTIPMETRQVVCDLGCGDGEFRKNCEISFSSSDQSSLILTLLSPSIPHIIDGAKSATHKC